MRIKPLGGANNIMDTATLLGLLGAALLVGFAAISGGNLAQFFDLASLMIVLGGSFFVVMAKFGMKQFLNAGRVAKNSLRVKTPVMNDLIVELVALAEAARRGGLLALEQKKVSNPFLKRGLHLVVDGTEPNTLQHLLIRDRQEAAHRHANAAQVIAAFGEVAPGMGLIGTLIGLVGLLSHMNDPKAIGPSMAIALLTTLYGAVLANCVFLPLADKLRLRAKEEAHCKSLMIDGLLGIQHGQNPRLLDALLRTYLPEAERHG